MRLLSDHEAIMELLSLMKGNGRKLKAAELSYMISAIDNIDRQYSELLSMLQNISKELTEANEQCRAVGAVPPDLSVYQAAQKEAEQILSKIAAAREKIVDWAETAVEDFKLIGVSALDTAMSALNVRNMLETLRKQARSSAWNILAATQRAETMGRETQSMGRHLKNFMRIIRGKETQTIDGGQEGRFQSALLAPIRTVRKMLPGASNAALISIGGAEHLSDSAKTARKARAERKTAEKSSIRCDLEEKKAQAAVQSAPDTDKTRRPPEVML